MADIDLKFKNFHNTNPQVYAKLVQFAREVKSAGFSKYSIWSLFARLRWHSQIETKGDTFKIRNDFTSRYSRLIMENEPDLKGLFTTRPLRGEKAA